MYLVGLDTPSEVVVRNASIGIIMWLFIAGFIATLVGCIYTWLAWNLNYWRKRGVPGPDAQLLAGSFPKAFYHKQNLVYEIDSAYK